MAEAMTPEQAEDIFYAAKRKAYEDDIENWSKPRVQRDVETKGWAAVIEAIRKETELELAKEMLDTGTFDCKSLSDPSKL